MNGKSASAIHCEDDDLQWLRDLGASSADSTESTDHVAVKITRKVGLQHPASNHHSPPLLKLPVKGGSGGSKTAAADLHDSNEEDEDDLSWLVKLGLDSPQVTVEDESDVDDDGPFETDDDSVSSRVEAVR